MAVEWTSDLATGIDEIDDQHREMFRRANALLAAMREGKARGEIEPTLDYLRSYFLEHFALEERVMAASGYHGLEQHRARHTQFAGFITEIERGFRDGARPGHVIIELVDRLSTYLRLHMGETDRQMARFLRSDKNAAAVLRSEFRRRP